MCAMAKAVTGQFMQYQNALRVRGYHIYEEIWEVAVSETIFMVKQLGAC